MTSSTDPGASAAVPFNRLPKKDVVYDLMRGGPGTPWENRGEFGPVGAFVRTAVRAMVKPGLLLDHIRGTTVTDDARRFLYPCAGLWGAAVAVHKAIEYLTVDTARYQVAFELFLAVAVLETAVGVGCAILMFRLVTRFYHKLATTEVKQPVPATLTYNVVAYTMGPSLLAPIPFVGPVLALAGIFAALVAAGRKRLFISWRGAVIDALLPFASAVILSAALYFVGGFVVDKSPLAPFEEQSASFGPPTGTPMPAASSSMPPPMSRPPLPPPASRPSPPPFPPPARP